MSKHTRINVESEGQREQGRVKRGEHGMKAERK